MITLPKGNYALCIAHPGHELRLHGFLEKASPFVFIFTDGSDRSQKDLMIDSIRVVDKCMKLGKKLSLAFLKSDASKKVFKISDHSAEEGKQHLKDVDVYKEIVNQNPSLFQFFIVDTMVKNLIKYKIDYLICDASEGTNVCHEMMNIMSDLAIKLVKKQTGREIEKYDFAIDKPFNEKLNDRCIRIDLDEAAVNRKLDSILKFPLALTDLKPNVSLDANLIIELRKMKDGDTAIKEMIKDINPDFLKYEYLRPYSFSEPGDEKYLKPLKEQLEKILFETTHVKLN